MPPGCSTDQPPGATEDEDNEIARIEPDGNKPGLGTEEP
jgi:hypothetical protein